MPLQSDLTLDLSKFDPKAVSEKTKHVNEYLIDVGKKTPTWWEVGAPKFREMRQMGETPLPKPVHLPQAQTMTIPSRDAGRDIGCRVFKPQNGRPSKGLLLHIHGGGWVLSDNASQDPLLEFLADNFQLTVLSVEYRLAPEHPYPAAPNDCYDVVEWLVDNAQKEFGCPLVVVSGESAGGHLSLLTCFHLQTARPDFAFRAVILNYGTFEVANFLPAVHHFDKPLILARPGIKHHIAAFLPTLTSEQRMDASISPFFADLKKMKLPLALFTIGTEDPLLEDSVLMATRWQIAGGKSVLKVYPGAPHGFNVMAPDMLDASKQWREDVREFLGSAL